MPCFLAGLYFWANLPHNKAMNSKRTKLLLILLIIFLIFFSLNKFGLNQIRNAIFLISSPFQKILWETGEKVSLSFGALFEVQNLKREAQELKKLNFQLQYQVISLKELTEENRALREALNLGLQKPLTLSLAKAISRTSAGDFILINQGKNEGISKGLPVITAEKILLGKIEEVFDNFSTVALISNPKTTFDIEVLTETEGVLGLAAGKGNFKVQFQFIPKEAQIKEGDIVITSDLGGNFPQGLLVGTIKTFKKSDIEPFLTGEIKPFFQEINLTNLFIIKEF